MAEIILDEETQIEKEMSEEHPDSDRQASALDHDWKEAVQKATNSASCRFVRRAPVVDFRSDHRVHFCQKEGRRKFFCVCWNEGCRHLRPDRKEDDGSCNFIPRKQKIVEKHANGKKEKKENV